MRTACCVVLFAVACGVPRAHPGQRSTPLTVLRDTFDDPARTARTWIATLPSTFGALARIDAEAMQLTSPDTKGEVIVRHPLDVSTLRGKRVRVRARARTSSAVAVARATIAVMPARGVASYADTAATRNVSSERWASIGTVIDVDRAASSGEVMLVLRGSGSAWFDDVEVTIVGEAASTTATVLSSQQVEHVVTLARVASHIRYLHPSDQVAANDWNAFLPTAVSRVLRVSDRAVLIDELRQLFATIAPTVAFVASGETAPAVSQTRQAGRHLARWYHLGLGNEGVYQSLRVGRDPDEVEVQRAGAIVVGDPKSCRSAKLEAKFHKGGDGTATLFIAVRRPGVRPAETKHELPADLRAVSVPVEIADDLQELRAGVRVKGRGTLTLESLALLCDSRQRIPVHFATEWSGAGDESLYRWTVSPCSTGTCATIERNALDTELVVERDVVELDVGSGLRMRMPLAVWSDAQRTYPHVAFEPPPRDATIHDLSVRVAAAATAWSTLALFYPYFKDQQLGWDAALPRALQAVAAARSPSETHEALSGLVADLRDSHARVMHPGAPINGVVPLALRRFDDSLVVVGGLSEFTENLPPGTEVISIDGTPALQAYDRVRARVSASTVGWLDYATPFYLTVGRPGTFRSFRFRLGNGEERNVLLPLVPRDAYDSAIREARPKTGTELASGVFYVDLEGLQKEKWQEVLPSLQRARALVFDLRGYTTGTGMETIASLIDRKVMSPIWQFPLVGSGRLAEPRYQVSQWATFPSGTRLKAPAVVLLDGRSASAVETILQMIKEAKLAVLVGETSAGTNGNVNTFEIPGELVVRFTGMRVSAPDGSTIQGRGITPDKVVRPTLEGLRAGRDEVLEAGIAEAQRLAHH